MGHVEEEWQSATYAESIALKDACERITRAVEIAGPVGTRMDRIER